MISNAKKVNTRTAERPCERVIDLCGDERARLTSEAVRDAMKAAAWELGGSHGKRGVCPQSAGSVLCEAVKDYLRGICAILPDCDVREDRGGESERVSLSGALARETDIAFPLPLGGSTLRAAREYYSAPRFFETGDPTEAPTPRDIVGKPPTAVYLPLVGDPTGVALSWEGLCEWVDYAVKHRVLLICDATFSVFCGAVEWRHRFPESVYCIPSASECAVEVASLSPSFRAGIGCGYCVLPSFLRVNEECLEAIRTLRGRERRTDHFSYVTDRGAAASLSPEGLCDSHRLARAYVRNARRICASLVERGFECATVGASPFVFGRFPDGTGARLFRDRLGIAVPSGEEFGLSDGGYIRLSAVLSEEESEEVLSRIERL